MLADFSTVLPTDSKVQSIIYRVLGKSDEPEFAAETANFFSARNLPGLYFVMPNDPQRYSAHLVGQGSLPVQEQNQ